MIVCAGRELDADAEPTGEPCGQTAAGVDLNYLRAAGWKIGPADPGGARPAMCPSCAKPDPALVRLCTALARSVHSRPEPAGTLDMDTLPGL